MSFVRELCPAVLAALLLAGCVTDSDGPAATGGSSENAALRRMAEAGPCGMAGRFNGVDRYEMPPEDLGNGHVGILTLSSHADDPKTGRYSMVQCRTAQAVRLDPAGQSGDIRDSLAALERQGAMTSLDQLQRAAPALQFQATRGPVRRSDDSRAGCACLVHYPNDWAIAAPADSSGRRPFLPK